MVHVRVHTFSWLKYFYEWKNEWIYKKTIKHFCITIFSTIHWIERLTAYQHVCKPMIGIWYVHTNTPVASITYTLTLTYSEDSNESVNSCSLFSVLVFHPKKHWTIGYPYSAHRRLIRLRGCAVWYESSMGVNANLYLQPGTSSNVHR